ncbi:MAG: lamin tail domain-containing protein [Bacteroidota bacterium]
MKKIYLLGLFLTISSTVFAQLIINEICYDPWNSGLDGDTNGDGMYAQAADEFLELYNITGQNLDISGYTIYDAENLVLGTPNHTVPANTIIPPEGVFVLFGGGTPTGTFGGAVVQTSTFGDLNMNNSGDTIYIFDTMGNKVDTFDIEPLSNNPNESYTRNPDITGAFEQHGDNFPILFSPGVRVDGTPFNTAYYVESLTVQGMGGATAITTMGGTLQMEVMVMPTIATDQTVTWSVMNGTGSATIDANGILTAATNGSVMVVATANDPSGVTGSVEINISGQSSSIQDLTAANQQITLYPNPASQFVRIEAPDRIEEVEIYSMEGKLVRQVTSETNLLKVEDLNTGIYLLRVFSDNSWKTVRLMIE